MTIKYKDLLEELGTINAGLKDYSNELFGENHWKSYAEVEAAPYPGETIRAKVNWSCMGQVEPEQARAMAELLTKAAEEAEGFKYNGYTVKF